jgi:hypothetical protein
VTEPAAGTDPTITTPAVTRAGEVGPWTGWPRLLLVAVLVGAVWVAIGVAVRPLRQTCDQALAADVCLETIDAAMRRGLSRVHPLLLAAHAAPGPAARPDQFGHRATVTFDVLGMPSPVSVRLFFDAGAHWGGIADREATEIALWSVGQGVAVAAVAGGSWLMLRRRTGRAPIAG